MSKLTIAAAQIECRPGDLQANLALHLAAIAEARSLGADAVVFPELSLADYVSTPDLPAVGLAADDPLFGRLREAAGHMALFVGFVERGRDGRHHAATWIADGAETRVHRKLNLPTYGSLVEGLHYQPGEALDLAPVKGWRSSVLICADAWNPALPWIAALSGAEILVIPVASALGAVDGAFDNPTGWEATLRQLAMTYGLPVVMVNHCGARGNLRFWGGSRILDPYGRELAWAGDGPGVVVATLDRADMLDAQRNLPTVRDANPALIRRLLDGLAAARPA